MPTTAERVRWATAITQKRATILQKSSTVNALLCDCSCLRAVHRTGHRWLALWHRDATSYGHQYSAPDPASLSSITLGTYIVFLIDDISLI